MTARKCSYCLKPSVVWARWRTSFAAHGSRRSAWTILRACAEHEGCVNWTSSIETHPDAEIRREVTL